MSAPMGIMPQAKKRYTLFTRPSRCGGMMVCRRLTVITFHVEPSSVPTANSTAVSGHHEDSPTSTLTSAPDPRVSARQVPLPSVRDSLATVDAVGDDARRQGEDQRRQPLRSRHQRHEQRVAGDCCRQPRVGNTGHAVADVGHRHCEIQLAISPAEADFLTSHVRSLHRRTQPAPRAAWSGRARRSTRTRECRPGQRGTGRAPTPARGRRTLARPHRGCAPTSS